MLGVTRRSVCLLGTTPIIAYVLLSALDNEYSHNNRVVVLEREALSEFLFETIKKNFCSHTGYTAAFWARQINSIPSITKTQVRRKPEKTWVVSIKQVQPKALINGKFVFCDQGLLDHHYFTLEQLKNCPQIRINSNYSYQQLNKFLPSIIAVGSSYKEKPSISINSDHDCLLTLNDISIQFAKDSFPIDKSLIEKVIEAESQLHKKSSFIVDIRFKNQIIIHRSKAVGL